VKAETVRKKEEIPAAQGKLGVLIPGIGGAVATTFIAGVEAIRNKWSLPIGSLTQMGTIRLGKRTENRIPYIKDFVSLARTEDIVFGGWDIFSDNCYAAAQKARVLEKDMIERLQPFLSTIEPFTGVYNRQYLKNLEGKHIKSAKTYLDLANAVKEDIQSFTAKNKIERCVIIWCASTETYLQPSPVHQSIEAFEKGLKENHPDIPPSMIYAYAAITSGIPYVNGAPNLTADVPALTELSRKHGVPLAGKDFKTGQTLLKTIIAPGLKSRMLGLEGWYSTNILGNRDGQVLEDPGSFKTKEESKLSALEHILQPDLYPDLYKNFYHKVAINYYPPRGDNKEGWDCIDIFGWLGYPMQIKLNFLCRDSILAAPLVLDLVLLADFAKRAGLSGIQEWLSFYFKSPMVAQGLYPEHDLFIQLMKLKNTLRYLMGEELITHLGLEYYMD
jgi:myo-inositol-1-phosphate synthase